MSKIFFSGIGGSGVSAIASFCYDRGDVVCGSDRTFDQDPESAVCRTLRNKGIRIVPQDGSGIDSSFDFAVFSTAVEANRPEALKVRQLGTTVKSRPEFLAEIAAAFRTAAVAGTSGKSTTAGMLAFLMDRLGMNPNYIGGGRVKNFRAWDNLGNSMTGSSDLLVMEACESDGSIVNYHPSYSIVANLHLDHNPIDQTASMFEALSGNTKEIVVTCADDENLDRCRFNKAIKFSVDRDSQYRAEEVEYGPLSTNFRLHGVPFRLSLPGKYNLLNALACIALLAEMGVGLGDVAEALPGFSGVERRFDLHLFNERHLVLDDYAHNPHKMSSLMETVKKIRSNICYIFQPHGFGPTRLMKRGYIETFIDYLRKGDHLILLPIYYAGGTSSMDISSEDLVKEIVAAGKSAEVLTERRLLFDRLREWESYVVFGARDESLSGFAEEIALRLKQEDIPSASGLKS